MKIETLDGNLLKKALKGAAKFLEDKKEEVNSLNVFPVPDGDTGTNMSLTMASAVKNGLEIETNSAYKVAKAASQGSLMGARGNSGVILSQLFRGFAAGLGEKDQVTTKELATAFKMSADTAYKAVMKPTEGTILTVARECGEYAVKSYKSEKDILSFLKNIIDHGNKSLDKTPDLLPVLKQAGVVDAGGKGYMCVLTGAYNALAGIDFIEEELIAEKAIEVRHEHIHLDTDDIKYGYCTEFMIDTKYDDINSFREELAVQGDSLMVVGGEGLIKVHIHTNNPGLALEKAIKLGPLKDIKIDNMRYQHEEVLLKKELTEARSNAKKESRINSFIAISVGDGIEDVFRDLNVDKLVSGGQTMNPSTEDILKAIDETTGENVFILPNNGNIILAAEQARELSDRNIFVIPTKTIPQGISALIAFNEELSPEENKEAMIDAIQYVKTGQVTYSVRDTEFNNRKISKDDIIGISDGEIVENGKNINKVAMELIGQMMDEDISLLTILYGEDLDEEEALALEVELSKKYDDIDIELIYGGQPLYYYIFSLE